MDNQRITQLAQKIVDANITEIELEEFNHWYYSDDGESYQVNSHQSKDELALAIYRNVIQRAELQKKPVKVMKLWPRVAVAAAVLLAFMVGGYFYYDSKIQPTETGAYQNDIAPGKNGATLTLANGQKIYVSDEKVGKLAQESGVSISKTADGQIIYEIASSPRNDAVQYNTLSTTRGEQFQVRLPDGTLVFLNAESSLKYPTSFAKLDQRQVTLTGEGYFEVAKDKAHPFIVKTSAQEVEVLGTHFNVNAYINEPSIKTTLVEGSVRISPSKENAKDLILKPGQQATLNNNALTVKEIDVERAVAWKNSTFSFENEDIKSIMRNVARWYNVEVVYEGDLPAERFGGGVSRFENVSHVLRILEKTGAVHFRIEGRKIIVSK
ncbi:FecR family protein [Pedobacter insulae]|uniref:FecR protein n=1 Tax=Pedobacter insulae TaxID=414048 RepID=A0A1I3AM72_9SPHI|nr:FecR family protein [Pedobacter insulae]SFH51113.1 FecR protein [Pedobacter insulae]